jgi:hypothetical protein
MGLTKSLTAVADQCRCSLDSRAVLRTKEGGCSAEEDEPGAKGQDEETTAGDVLASLPPRIGPAKTASPRPAANVRARSGNRDGTPQTVEYEVQARIRNVDTEDLPSTTPLRPRQRPHTYPSHCGRRAHRTVQLLARVPAGDPTLHSLTMQDRKE